MHKTEVQVIKNMKSVFITFRIIILISGMKNILANPGKNKIVTINSWNEWSEGSYLEPDTIHKMEYLEAIKDVYGNQR